MNYQMVIQIIKNSYKIIEKLKVSDVDYQFKLYKQVKIIDSTFYEMLISNFTIKKEIINDSINLIISESIKIEPKNTSLFIYHKILKTYYQYLNEADNNNNSNNNYIYSLVIIESFLNHLNIILSSSSSSSKSILSYYHFYSIINKLLQILNVMTTTTTITVPNDTTPISIHKYEIINILNNNIDSINKLIKESLNNEFYNNNNIENTDNCEYSSFSILNKILKIFIEIFEMIENENNLFQQKQNEILILNTFLNNLILLVSSNEILIKIINFDNDIINNLEDQLNIPILFTDSKSGASILLSKIYKILLQLLNLLLEFDINNNLFNLIEQSFFKNNNNNNNNNNKNNINQDIINKLGYIFFNQDDIAIDIMFLLLLLYNKFNNNNNNNFNNNNYFKNYLYEKIKYYLNPDSVFYFFIKNICHYDHLLIIDMLISNETKFLNYFLKYLKFGGGGSGSGSGGGKTSNTHLLGGGGHNEENDENKIRFKECLSALRNSIMISMSNDSFPYNPRLLLSRLELLIKNQ
ncbi:hypothetical protein ACTFIR_002321 [Dictyostelium discoideum]